MSVEAVSIQGMSTTVEDLEGYVDSLRHDRILWIGVTSDPRRNDQNGVKVVVKVRGTRWNTRLGADKNHKAKGWLKTTLCKTRSGEWRLIEDGCQCKTSVSLPTEDGLGYCVQFHYPAGRRNSAAYTWRLVVSRESRSPKKRYVKRKQPPTPPKINVRLTSVPREKVGKVTPKDEENEESPSKKSNAASTVVPEDAGDTSEDSEDITSTSPLSVEVKAKRNLMQQGSMQHVSWEF